MGVVSQRSGVVRRLELSALSPSRVEEGWGLSPSPVASDGSSRAYGTKLMKTRPDQQGVVGGHELHPS